MKILCIRGRNLASLGGDFRVDLRAEPLSIAGLFAIHGPTGSGKTTILDAVCLALYGMTPRSRQGTSTRIADASGMHVWSTRDDRHIVRRGARDAYAEVLFEANGESYEARWSVTAATRGSTKGSLKDPVMALRRLRDDAELARGKKQQTEQIEAITGLGFDNFCRSVLLAQGEFAAFIEADASSRAAVLEALTDPDGLYRKLSVAAQKKGAMAAERRREAQNAIDAIALLEDAARAEIESEIKAAASRVAAITQERTRVEKELSNVHAIYTIETRIYEAEQKLREAHEASDSDATLRTLVAEADSVRELRAPRSRRDEAIEHAKHAERALLEAREDLERVRHMHAMRNAELAAAHKRAADHDDKASHLKPFIDRARLVDSALDATRTRVYAAHATLHALAQEHALYTQRGNELSLLLTQNRTRQRDLEAWMKDHPDDHRLASRVDAWRIPLEAYVRDAKKIAGITLSHDRVARDLLDAQTRAVQAETECERAANAEHEAAARATASDERAQALRGLVSLTRARECEAKLRALHALERNDKELVHARERARQASETIATNQQTHASVEQDAAALRHEIARAEEQLHLARERFSLARTQASVEHLRAALRAGEPCVVCGSPEHPWSNGANLIDLASARDEELLIDAEIKRLRENLRLHETRLAQLSGALAHASSSLTESDRDIDRLERERNDRIATFETLASLAAADRRSADALMGELDRLVSEVQRELDDLTQKDAQYTKQTELTDQARKELVAAKQLVSEKTKTHLQLIEKVAEHKHALASLAQEQSDTLARMNDAWRQAEPFVPLDAPREHIRALFTERPQATLSDWLGRVDAFAATQKQVAELAIEAQRLAVEAAAHDAELAAVKARHASAAAAVQELQTQLSGLEDQRSALLNGRPVPDVERELDSERTRLSEGVQIAMQSFIAAQNDLVRAEERATHGASVASQKNAQCKELSAMYAHARDAQGLSEDEAARRLCHSDEHVQAARTRITEHQSVLAAAERRLGELREELARMTPPPSDVATLEEALQKLDAERTQLDQTIGAREHVLREDDRHRSERAKREAALRDLEAHDGVWGQLADLIGHAKGDTFAMFAQTLSFDSLLRAANRELGRLRPRYVLSRPARFSSPAESESSVQGLELAVQDTEFGGQLRPINTLSGGEKFLTALALALGMSAMASNQQLLGTLFIDEGFGTLDSETLAIAMDALRTLQQRGTQVGIISHVADLLDHVQARVCLEKVHEGLSRVNVGAHPMRE